MNSNIAFHVLVFLVIISVGFMVFFCTPAAATEDDVQEWTVNTVDWKPDGSYALIGGTGGLIARYDGESLAVLSDIRIEPKQIAWNPSGTEALIVGHGGIYSLEVDFSSLRLGSDLDYGSVEWNPAGTYALIGGHICNGDTGYSASLLRYDGSDLEDITHLMDDNSNVSISLISWNPKDEFALIYKDDGKLYGYRDDDITLITETGGIFDLVWKPDGSEAFFLYEDLSLASWDPHRPGEIDVLSGGYKDLNWSSGMLSWKPDGGFSLVIGNNADDGRYRIYKYDGAMTFIEEVPNKRVNCAAWHPLGDYVLVGGSYGSGGLLQKIVIHDENPEVGLSPSLVAIPIIAIAIIAYLGLTETGRFTTIQFLFLPLFAKIRKRHPLENKMRELIYEYIELYPGENYTTIKKTLGLANGTLVYHLKILKEENLIISVSEGRYKRFYPTESDKLDLTKIYGHEGPQMLTELEKKIIEKMEEEPEISQVEVARSLGVSRQLVNYHIIKLIKAGVLKHKEITISKSCAQ